MSKPFDIVIVGSGIAGLSTILYLSETQLFKSGELSVCLVCKGKLDETNTNWAQGGIAAVKSIEDNFEKHVEDTMKAGAYANNKQVVQKVVHAAPELLNDLIAWGTQFDKNSKGQYDLAKEGGHSDPRIWHNADHTGKSIQESLLKNILLLPNIHILEHACVISVYQITNHFFVIRIFDVKTQKISTIISKKLVVATGGVGMLYDKTTNQQIATGDGIYLANQLGAINENLSFIQFHPTGLYESGQTSFLISEALRGAGAILRNEKGEVFMHKYDHRLELAPRDIVSRAIMSEITLQKKRHVYLDATQIESSILNAHFPSIKQACKNRLGLDLKKDYIPVVPVQHYSCGGIQVNEFGETTIKGLFALGEVASTGLHGANRLASNSLLEGIAFAKFCIPKLLDMPTPIPIASDQIIEAGSKGFPSFKMAHRGKVQFLMSNYAGVVKTKEGLEKALSELNKIKNSRILSDIFVLSDFETNCILEVAILLIKDALLQTKNIGVFYNIDLEK